MKLITLIILSITVVVCSMGLDVIEFLGKENHWLQRSGSILVLLGVLFESKYILRSSFEGKNVIEGGLVIPGQSKSKDNTNILLFDFNRIKTHAGFYIILLGTVIWGYGDLAEVLYT